MASLQGIVAALTFFAIAEAFNNTLNYRVCNGALYDKTGSYGDVASITMGNIIKSRRPWGDFDDYYACPSPPPSGEVDDLYVCGHGSCDKALTMTECSQCLEQVTDRLYELCTHSSGAQARLQDCMIRYEHYYFRD